ncbi:hypothetical protein [Cupriavidus necator]
MTRKFPWVEPLAAGTYCATCREQTAEAAERNGHGAVYPSARCHSDGKWVAFWRDGDEVWGCNATYAAAHFTFTPWSPTA